MASASNIVSKVRAAFPTLAAASYACMVDILSCNAQASAEHHRNRVLHAVHAWCCVGVASSGPGDV